MSVGKQQLQIRYLDVADLLLIASATLGLDVRHVKRFTNIALAESALMAPAAQFAGVERYPTLPLKAAVLCSRINRNHAFPDGNKRVSLLAAIMFVESNGEHWSEPAQDQINGDESFRIICAVARGQLSEDLLAQWIADRLG